jgi:hypothetical protein
VALGDFSHVSSSVGFTSWGVQKFTTQSLDVDAAASARTITVVA